MQSFWHSGEPEIKKQHFKNKTSVISNVINEFGTVDSNGKIENLIDLGNSPFSILAFHNKFLRQIRSAFVISAYYPALTGACALGERILNHLLIKLRGYYSDTPEYKNVYDKSSFDNWDTAIDTLTQWEILLPDVAESFSKLAEIRNRRAIHFNPDTDLNDREPALEAIRLLSDIISLQFGALGPQPWFIEDIRGSGFIKKEAETWPFVREIYLPNCVLVGPDHTLSSTRDELGQIQWIVSDDFDYGTDEITDEEFATLYNK